MVHVPLAVTGPRGTTVAAAMCAWIFESVGLEPGFLLDGWAQNFSASTRPLPTKRKIVGGAAKAPPFVVDRGHLRDSRVFVGDPATPRGRDGALLVTGVPDENEGADANANANELGALVARVPEAGLVACNAAAADACVVVLRHAIARTAFYGVDADEAANPEVTPTWLGALAARDRTSGARPFDLYAGGSSCGRFALKTDEGDDDVEQVRSAVGAIAVCAEGFGVALERIRRAIASFEGVRPRAPQGLP